MNKSSMKGSWPWQHEVRISKLRETDINPTIWLIPEQRRTGWAVNCLNPAGAARWSQDGAAETGCKLPDLRGAVTMLSEYAKGLPHTHTKTKCLKSGCQRVKVRLEFTRREAVMGERKVEPCKQRRKNRCDFLHLRFSHAKRGESEGCAT